MAGGAAGKCKKEGRNDAKCQRYKLKNQRLKNKLRGMIRHMRTHVMCPDFQKAMDKIKTDLSIVEQRPIFAEYGITM